MKNNLDNILREFILKEGQISKPSLESLVESLTRILESMRPKSRREQQIYEVAKYQIKEIKNGIKRLIEEKRILEERVKLLEEDFTHEEQ